MSNIERVQNYINGEWKASSSGESTINYNPANVDEAIGSYQLSTANDFDDAVAAAKAVKESWRETTGNVRGDLLMKAANILEERTEDKIGRASCRERE